MNNNINYLNLKIKPIDYFIDNQGYLNIKLPTYHVLIHCMSCDDPVIKVDGLREEDDKNITMVIPKSIVVCGPCFEEANKKNV